jgi:type III secretion system YscQ/HrcQ family protein
MARPVVPLVSRLPVLSFDDVDSTNAVARYRGTFTFKGRYGDLAARVCHPRIIETANISFAAVVVEIDGETARIHIPARVLTAVALMAKIEVNFAEVSEEGRALLFEHVLDDLLSHVEAQGCRIRIDRIDNPRREPSGQLGLIVQFGSLPPAGLLIEASPKVCRLLLDAANQLPVPRAGFDDVPVLVQIVTGITALNRAGLNSLVEGDTVLFDHSWMHERRAAMVVGSNMLLSATVCARGYTLDSKVPVLDLRERLIWLAEDTTSAGAYMDNRQTPTLDSLEVKLVFEVGRAAMTLAELNRIDAGHVFELNRAPEQAVDIFVMNRQIGSGELVVVGERIGVRITRITR